MIASTKRLSRTFLSAIGLTDRLFAFRANRPKPTQRRARLGVMPLEERVLMDAKVALTHVADASEAGTAGVFRFTRTGDEAAVANPLTVSVQLGGAAQWGVD